MASFSFLQSESALASLPADVERFCVRQGLIAHLSVALDLVERCFRYNQEPTLQTEQDPETGEEWVTIGITVGADAPEFIDRYDQYTSEIVVRIPWPQRDKIRLSYRLV